MDFRGAHAMGGYSSWISGGLMPREVTQPVDFRGAHVGGGSCNDAPWQERGGWPLSQGGRTGPAASSETGTTAGPDEEAGWQGHQSGIM